MKENYITICSNKQMMFYEQRKVLECLNACEKIKFNEYIQQVREISDKEARLRQIEEEFRKTNNFTDGTTSFFKWALLGVSGIFALYSNLGTLRSNGLSSFKAESGFGNVLGIVILLWPIISGAYIVSDVRLYFKTKEKRENLLCELKNL